MGKCNVTTQGGRVGVWVTGRVGERDGGREGDKHVF